MKRLGLIAITLAATQPACIVVGGYSSRGGWFLWPGGFGLVILIVIVLLLMRR